MEDIKRRLFLTGAIGCGKSTAISRALGSKVLRCGGFLTRRRTEGGRKYFCLEKPDGTAGEIFLDVSGSSPTVKPQVFSGFGLSLLCGDAVVLDEIGGIELLSPEFSGALYRLLKSDVPIIGVLKSPDSAKTMVKALGMYEEFLPAAERLRAFLLSDEDTLLYQCGQYDENALLLAQRWVRKYIND